MRLLMEKQHNQQDFYYTMRKAWKLTIPMKFRDLGCTITSIEFKNQKDKDSVIHDGPWS